MSEQQNKGGRPTSYSPEMLAKAQEYLDLCNDEAKPKDETLEPQAHGGALKREKNNALIVRIPTKGGLARFLDVARDTLYEWANVHPEFSDIMESLGSEQEDRLINNGLSGAYNPTIAKLLLSKHGYNEKIEQELSNPDGSLSPYRDLSKEQLEKLAGK